MMISDPIEQAWPPAYLGEIPYSDAPVLEMPEIESVKNCGCPLNGLADAIVDDPKDFYLLMAWSASLECINGNDYLALPPVDFSGNVNNWEEVHHSKYPSHKILIRDCYKRAASMFLQFAQERKNRMAHMLLGGTSGIGKTFFVRYFVWRLFNPDGPGDSHDPSTYPSQGNIWSFAPSRELV
jgi:hypothetical protein